MAERPAVNASPLIFLSRAGLVELLQLVADEVIVPQEVAREIEQRGPRDPAVQAIAETSWLHVIETPPVPPLIQSWDLGRGESAVLSWCAAHPDTEGIIDDLAARRCANALGYPVRGTLGLVILGKRRGRLREARPVLEALRASGMYLSDKILDRALSKVGE